MTEHLTQQPIRLVLATAIALQLASVANSQVVQLPTFQQFSVNTTVSVPDGGAVQLGRVISARSGSTTNSVPLLGRLPVVGRAFQNRGIGRESSVTSSHVKVQIIDLREMDEAVLEQARRARLTQSRVGAEFRIANGKPLGAIAAGVAAQPKMNAAEVRAKFLTDNMGRSNVLRIPSSPIANSQAKVRKRPQRTASQPEPPLILSNKKL